MHMVWQEMLSANANALLLLMSDDFLTSISKLVNVEGWHAPCLSLVDFSNTNTRHEIIYQHKHNFVL